MDTLERAYRNVTSRAPRRPSVEHLVGHCFTTAAAYLRLQQPNVLLERMNNAPDDPVEGLALQVMARLFKRDARQRFSYFRAQVEEVPGERPVTLRSRLRRAVVAETDQVVLEAYRASHPLASTLEHALSVRAAPLALGSTYAQEQAAEGTDRSERSTRPYMPQQLLQWHVEQHLEADSLDTFLETAATQLRRQQLYRPMWSLSRVALALHSLAATRADGDWAAWPAPLLVVADVAIFAAAQELLSLDGSLKPPGGSPASAAEELAGRLRQIWPHLRDGHAEVPTLAALAPATVARLTRRAEQLLTGKL